MNENEITQSPLFKKLLADAHNMEEDLRNFNMLYQQFLNRDEAAVSRILRSHLIAEHFLDGYLRAANPVIQEWDAARLTFAQKLELADNPRSSIHMLLPGLRCLNRLRNHVAHRLQAETTDDDLQQVREFVSMWHGALGKPLPDGLNLLEAFVLIASGWLHGAACMIQRHTPEHGLSGLFAWYRHDLPQQGDSEPRLFT
jgi:hypothetical protein